MPCSFAASPRSYLTVSPRAEFSAQKEVPLAAERIAHSQEQLVLEHMPQVRLVARSLWERARFAVELDDLIGYGMLGLLDAVRKFDPGRGVMLKTYAEHRIRGAILDGLRGMDWLSRSARRNAKSRPGQQQAEDSENLSTHVRKQAPVALEIHGTGDAHNGEPATAPRELVRRAAPRLTSLFCGGGVGEIERLYQNACSPVDWAHHQPTPERLLERKQERTALAEAIECLPERQRQVLDLYYRQELSMKQIASLLGVHESRVSQIHLAAITRLRKSLHPKAARTALRMPTPVVAKPCGNELMVAIAG